MIEFSEVSVWKIGGVKVEAEAPSSIIMYDD